MHRMRPGWPRIASFGWDRAGAVRSLVVGGALVLAGCPPGALDTQPVTGRSPNLEGTWVTSERNLYFGFSHRFEVVGGDVDVADIFGDAKIVSYPTFQLAYGLLDDVNLGFRYSSNSTLAGGPNEWQPYVKWSPVRSTGGSRPGVSATAAWNGAAESADGELSAQVRVGRLGLLGAVRGFSNAFDPAAETGEASLALAGGAVFHLTRFLALGGDVGGLVAGADGHVAWSAGLLVGIPYTPHTFSILATNVTSGTLQGVSTGAPGVVYWGFEFTVPFSGFARWGDIFDPAEGPPPAARPEGIPAEAPSGARETPPTGRVVELRISGFEYGQPELTVPAGTTVRWLNRDPVGHTVTGDAGDWTSPLIGPGEVFERTFGRPGDYPYHCIPHPYMRGKVTVVEATGAMDTRTSEGR